MQLVGICSNDPTDYPDDAPARLLARWREKGFGFPYGVDASQDVARAFGAVCTPEFFVYGPDRRLAYHGRLDDSWRDPAQGDAARAGGRVRRAARRARAGARAGRVDGLLDQVAPGVVTPGRLPAQRGRQRGLVHRP